VKEGDEISSDPLQEAGDVIFLLKQKPHSHFTRRGANDLVFIANISLSQALIGTTLEIPTLDRRILSIALNEIATPKGKKIIPGEGLPHIKTGVKGNLVIEFNINFPEQLTMEQKTEIKKLLPQ